MEENFSINCEKAIDLGEHVELILRRMTKNSILCDLITENITVENLFIHRNITNKLLDGKLKRVTIQHMDNGDKWCAVTSRW